MTPVAHWIQIAKLYWTTLSLLCDHRCPYAQLSGYELTMPYRTLMIKWNGGYNIQSINSTKVLTNEVCTHFGNSVWRDWFKWTLLVKEDTLITIAIHLASWGVQNYDFIFDWESLDCWTDIEDSLSVCFEGVLGHCKRMLHMALSCKVIDWTQSWKFCSYQIWDENSVSNITEVQSYRALCQVWICKMSFRKSNRFFKL